MMAQCDWSLGWNFLERPLAIRPEFVRSSCRVRERCVRLSVAMRCDGGRAGSVDVCRSWVREREVGMVICWGDL
jgi:hypothetical protein